MISTRTALAFLLIIGIAGLSGFMLGLVSAKPLQPIPFPVSHVRFALDRCPNVIPVSQAVAQAPRAPKAPAAPTNPQMNLPTLPPGTIVLPPVRAIPEKIAPVKCYGSGEFDPVLGKNNFARCP